MRRVRKSWALTAVAVMALTSVLAPRAQAQMGSITGTIKDVAGKPWADVTVRSVSEQGAKQETKTDSSGKYSLNNLKTGIYNIFIVYPPPNNKQPPYEGRVQVQSGDATNLDFDFKDIVSKQGAAAQEQMKKQEEAKTKMASLKEHFNAGNTLLAQEKQAREELTKAPADQRDAAKQKLADVGDKTIAEFKEASKSLVEKDPNAHLIWFKLGDAYETAGQYPEAVQAYQQAIAAKPDTPAYYNNLGNALSKSGKIEEAKAAYTKSAELDPPNAATAWRNFGITLYNANRLGDAIEPLQKSAELDPKNPQTWYLLGASLVYKLTTKKVGDKEVIEFAPGTIEAYQKAIELDPNGPWGTQAKQGLEQLNAMSGGIDTKVNVRKKKP